MSLTLITDSVRPDEKAWWLVEVITTPLAIRKRFKGLHLPGTAGRHRYQIVTVNRGDRLTRHITDMGPASLYDCGGLNLPGCWENTVAQLREVADQWRNDQRWEKEVIEEAQSRSTLIDTWLKQEEQKPLVGQSVFGPGISRRR